MYESLSIKITKDSAFSKIKQENKIRIHRKLVQVLYAHIHAYIASSVHWSKNSKYKKKWMKSLKIMLKMHRRNQREIIQHATRRCLTSWYRNEERVFSKNHDIIRWFLPCCYSRESLDYLDIKIIIKKEIGKWKTPLEFY